MGEIIFVFSGLVTICLIFYIFSVIEEIKFSFSKKRIFDILKINEVELSIGLNKHSKLEDKLFIYNSGGYYYVSIIKKYFWKYKIIDASEWVFFANDDGGWRTNIHFKDYLDALEILTSITNGKRKFNPKNGDCTQIKRIGNFLTNA